MNRCISRNTFVQSELVAISDVRNFVWSNLWNEREARQNEWENSLLVVRGHANCSLSCRVVTQMSRNTRQISLTMNTWLRRSNRLDPNGRHWCDLSSSKCKALLSQNAALEAQLISHAEHWTKDLQNCKEQSAKVLSRSQAVLRRMLVNPKGVGH